MRWEEEKKNKKKNREWAERFLPLSDDMAGRGHGRLTPLARWQPRDGGNRRGTGAVWQDKEPDNTLPISQLPTNTAHSATDCQLLSQTYYSKRHCGAVLHTSHCGASLLPWVYMHLSNLVIFSFPQKPDVLNVAWVPLISGFLSGSPNLISA